MRGPKGPSLRPAWRGGPLAVLLVLMLTTLMSSSEALMQRCHRPPRFSVNGVEPMALARGQMTLVALVLNTCPYCIQQATMLERLHAELEAAGTPVHMMLIDAGPPGTNVFRNNFFDVYQDDQSQRMWRQVFNGSKDDIIIFNRCGMMTYHLWHPYSYLGYNLVRHAIRNTANNPNLCENCLIRDPHDIMMGDAPAAADGGVETRLDRHSSSRVHGGGRGHHRGRPGGRSHNGHNHRNNNNNPNSSRRSANRSRCPRDDALCRELRRDRRRYNRFRKQHLLTQNPNVNEEAILALLARRSGNRYFPRMRGGGGSSGGGGGAVAGAAPVA